MKNRSYLIKTFTRRDRNNNNKHPQQTNNDNQRARENVIKPVLKMYHTGLSFADLF